MSPYHFINIWKGQLAKSIRDCCLRWEAEADILHSIYTSAILLPCLQMYVPYSRSLLAEKLYWSFQLLNWSRKAMNFSSMKSYISGSVARKCLQMTNFYFTWKKSVKKRRPTKHTRGIQTQKGNLCKYQESSKYSGGWASVLYAMLRKWTISLVLWPLNLTIMWFNN